MYASCCRHQSKGTSMIDLLVIFGVLVLGAVICLAVIYAFVKAWEHR